MLIRRSNAGQAWIAVRNGFRFIIFPVAARRQDPQAARGTRKDDA